MNYIKLLTYMNRPPVQNPHIHKLLTSLCKLIAVLLLVESRENPRINKTLRDLIILTEMIEQNGH